MALKNKGEEDWGLRTYEAGLRTYEAGLLTGQENMTQGDGRMEDIPGYVLEMDQTVPCGM